MILPSRGSSFEAISSSLDIVAIADNYAFGLQSDNGYL
jgi:hypothetical protein